MSAETQRPTVIVKLWPSIIESWQKGASQFTSTAFCSSGCWAFLPAEIRVWHEPSLPLRKQKIIHTRILQQRSEFRMNKWNSPPPDNSSLLSPGHFFPLSISPPSPFFFCFSIVFPLFLLFSLTFFVLLLSHWTFDFTLNRTWMSAGWLQTKTFKAKFQSAVCKKGIKL